MEEIKRQISDMDARLRAIEAREGRILTVLDTMTEKLESGLKGSFSAQSKVENILLGSNGNPGLLIKVDRMEQSQERTKWFVRALGGAIISIVAAAVFGVMR